MFYAFQSYRWLEQLSALISSYNATYHRSIGRTPKSVNATNRRRVFRRLYAKYLTESGRFNKQKRMRKAKFRTGDIVRLQRIGGRFERPGRDFTWTGEHFVVGHVDRRHPIPMYIVMDIYGDAVPTSFYQQELQKIEPLLGNHRYRVERVLGYKRARDSATGRMQRFALVKFLGWRHQFNSWIKASDLSINHAAEQNQQP